MVHHLAGDMWQEDRCWEVQLALKFPDAAEFGTQLARIRAADTKRRQTIIDAFVPELQPPLSVRLAICAAAWSELQSYVWDAEESPQANHVLQLLILQYPDCRGGVVQDLKLWAGQLAVHRHGCRVLQRLLETTSYDLMWPMLAVLFCDPWQ